MDLDSLRCFDAAATTLNFRAAAKRVHLSPAAFSDRISRLEEDLDTSLFVRSTRRVALSPAASHLLRLAREILSGADRLKAAARAAPEADPIELTIGTRYELGLSWLVPSLPALSRARPERTIHFYNGDTPDLLARLHRGDLDAVVASMRLSSPRLTYATLHSEEYVLVAASPCLRRRENAHELTLVDVSPDLPLFRYLLDALPDAEPWPFAGVEYMGGIGNIRRRLLDEPGRVAVLPRYFVQGDLRARRLVRLLPRAPLRSDAFRLIWRRNHPRGNELVELAHTLRKIPLR
jgi:DNA-binding transcriptional LysR family regulator